MSEKAIIKPYQNVLSKDSNQKTIGMESPQISEVFLVSSNQPDSNTFTVTKFQLNIYEPTVFINGEKQINPKHDPSPTYVIDKEANTIRLLGTYGVNSKVEVVSNYNVPTSENELVLYFETKTVGETNTFLLPWEFDYRNKGVTVFVNGSMVANSLLRCPNSFTVDLVIAAPDDATVVILARRLFTSPDLYSKFFATLPNGTVLYYTGNTCPMGFIKGDRSPYSRDLYPIFTSWIIKDGNYLENESDKNLEENLSKYVFTNDGNYFLAPDLRGRTLEGSDTVGENTSIPIGSSGTEIVYEKKTGYMPIIKADGPEKTGVSLGESTESVFTRLDEIDNQIIVLGNDVATAKLNAAAAIQTANSVQQASVKKSGDTMSGPLVFGLPGDTSQAAIKPTTPDTLSLGDSATHWGAAHIKDLFIYGSVSGNLFKYGTCTTASATALKVVACPGFAAYVGALISVRFNNLNSASGMQLNVNSTGAYPVFLDAAAISSATGLILSGGVYLFQFDGSRYNLVNPSPEQGKFFVTTRSVTIPANTDIFAYALSIMIPGVWYWGSAANITANSPDSSSGFNYRIYGVVKNSSGVVTEAWLEAERNVNGPARYTLQYYNNAWNTLGWARVDGFQGQVRTVPAGNLFQIMQTLELGRQYYLSATNTYTNAPPTPTGNYLEILGNQTINLYARATNINSGREFIADYNRAANSWTEWKEIGALQPKSYAINSIEQIVTSSGTITIPKGKHRVHVQGGGGGGGSSAAPGSAGGGSGGYRAWDIDVTADVSCAVVIGAGGSVRFGGGETSITINGTKYASGGGGGGPVASGSPNITGGGGGGSSGAGAAGASGLGAATGGTGGNGATGGGGSSQAGFPSPGWLSNGGGGCNYQGTPVAGGGMFPGMQTQGSQGGLSPISTFFYTGVVSANGAGVSSFFGAGGYGSTAGVSGVVIIEYLS